MGLIWKRVVAPWVRLAEVMAVVIGMATVEQLPMKPWLQAHILLLRQLALIGHGQDWSMAELSTRRNPTRRILLIFDIIITVLKIIIGVLD